MIVNFDNKEVCYSRLKYYLGRLSKINNIHDCLQDGRSGQVLQDLFVVSQSDIRVKPNKQEFTDTMNFSCNNKILKEDLTLTSSDILFYLRGYFKQLNGMFITRTYNLIEFRYDYQNSEIKIISDPYLQSKLTDVEIQTLFNFLMEVSCCSENENS